MTLRALNEAVHVTTQVRRAASHLGAVKFKTRSGAVLQRKVHSSWTADSPLCQKLLISRAPTRAPQGVLLRKPELPRRMRSLSRSCHGEYASRFRIITMITRARYGGGFEPRFNPGSNSGAGSEGGEAEYQHQEPGFNPGSTQVQPRFNPGSTQVQPRFNPV